MSPLELTNKDKIEEMIFSFGQSEHERIEVDVDGYLGPASGNFYDDNWLEADICVCAGGFRGKVNASILTGELAAFLLQLRSLYEKLAGSAQFRTMEKQLSLDLVGDGKGHIELRGEVIDQSGIGNRLLFTLEFDQSQLGASIRELEQVTSQFPVRSA